MSKKMFIFYFLFLHQCNQKINEIFGFIYMCGEKMELEKATFESQIVIRKMGLKHTKKTQCLYIVVIIIFIFTNNYFSNL